MSVFAQNSNELFADLTAFENEQKKEHVYPLALSALKKINGEWHTESEEFIVGDVHSRTYELKRPYTLSTTWARIQQHFYVHNSQLIYECIGLSCGSSNAWANERFAVKQLYGLDLSQHYQVWKTTDGNDETLDIIYLVERGNRRVYLQRDILTPILSEQESPLKKLVPSTSVVAKYFYRDREIQLRGITFVDDTIAIDENSLRPFAEAFNRQPFRSIDIVAYDYSEDASNDQRALEYAQSVVTALRKLGVEKKRMKISSVVKPLLGEAQESGAERKIIVKLPSR